MNKLTRVLTGTPKFKCLDYVVVSGGFYKDMEGTLIEVKQVVNVKPPKFMYCIQIEELFESLPEEVEMGLPWVNEEHLKHFDE